MRSPLMLGTMVITNLFHTKTAPASQRVSHRFAMHFIYSSLGFCYPSAPSKYITAHRFNFYAEFHYDCVYFSSVTFSTAPRNITQVGSLRATLDSLICTNNVICRNKQKILFLCGLCLSMFFWLFKLPKVVDAFTDFMLLEPDLLMWFRTRNSLLFGCHIWKSRQSVHDRLPMDLFELNHFLKSAGGGNQFRIQWRGGPRYLEFEGWVKNWVQTWRGGSWVLRIGGRGWRISSDPPFHIHFLKDGTALT